MKSEVKYVLYNNDAKKYDKGNGELTSDIYEVPRSDNINVTRGLLSQKSDPVNWDIQEIQVNTDIKVIRNIEKSY